MSKVIAINRREYAAISFNVDDVAGLDVCSTEWDTQKCHDALKHVEKELKERTREFGCSMLSDLIEEFVKEEDVRWAVRAGPWTSPTNGRVELYLYWRLPEGVGGGRSLASYWTSDVKASTWFNSSDRATWSLPEGAEWIEVDQESIEFDNASQLNNITLSSKGNDE